MNKTERIEHIAKDAGLSKVGGLTPEQELKQADGWGPGPYYLLPAQVDMCMARYGRLPKGFQPYPKLPAQKKFHPSLQLISKGRSAR